MKKLPLLFLIVTTIDIASARVITVPVQPVSPYLDTEVSTNVVLHTSRTDTRGLDVHIQFDGNPSNNLEVAFGRDVNTNGVLEVEEIETVYGWRGGRYFIENVPAWDRIETQPASGATGGVLDIHLENTSDVIPKHFTASCGGISAFADFTNSPPAWLFRREWTHMRVTRRGVGIPSGWVRSDIGYNYFHIKLR